MKSTILALVAFGAAAVGLSFCQAEKLAKPRFVDVSAASGLKVGPKTGVGGTNPHAVGVDDFNGDGLADVIILTFGKPHVYYFRNTGNLTFKDVTAGSGLETFEGDGTGVAIADFDRDGVMDVCVTSLAKGRNRLYRGKGDGTFTDVTEKAGVLLASAGRSCSWADIDNDGWPDLYVTCPSGPNALFRNKGDGTFVNIAREAGVELADRHSLGCTFTDIDGDGRDDLFVANYQSQPSALFKNLGGGKFEDITAPSGLTRRASAVGCTFGDLFNRGRFDLYVSTDSWLSGANSTEKELLAQKHTVEPNALYVSDGKGRFTMENDPALLSKTLGHDVILEDLDHDGLPEIYVAVDAESGNQWATSKGGNPLWTRPDGKTWREMGKDWGVRHEANCVCSPAADFDNDGDLDLLLVNFYTQPVLLKNQTDDKNWLRVKAVGTKGSRDGLGAVVSVFRNDEKGTRLGTRAIHSGAGYCRASPLEAHFGLGRSPAENYRVEVRFPASGRTVVQDGVRAGQRIVVREE